MQNKGIVKFIAVLLILVCCFYLSFSFVTRHYESKAAAMGEQAGAEYLDSINNEKVYMGIYSLKQCREMEIGLGLDLKGGMNVILEVSVPDVVDVLADHKTDAAYKKAMELAKKEEETSQADFVSLFIKYWKQEGNGRPLAAIFATQQMKGKVSTQSSDSEVESAIRAEVQSAVDNSFNVVRNRIDKFGVVQPNIQKLEGQSGRIMVEMPGIKEPERVRKLLQGSANLEFWETYNLWKRKTPPPWLRTQRLQPTPPRQQLATWQPSWLRRTTRLLTTKLPNWQRSRTRCSLSSSPHRVTHSPS